MLRKLHIENYALISRLDLSPDRGLNIITGETGAGKSILLGALGLLLGNRADVSVLKDTGQNCLVEGIFDIADYGLEELFEQYDLEYEPETVIRRVISPSGKSRAYINDLPVQLNGLKEIGVRLIDIHSQHQSLRLSDPLYRLSILDGIAGDTDLLHRYKSSYDHLRSITREIEKLRVESAASERDREWLQYQCSELEAAALAPGEQDELEAVRDELANSDMIKEIFSESLLHLGEEEIGILSRAKQIDQRIGTLRSSFSGGNEIWERLRAARTELKDIYDDISDRLDRLDGDPERLQKIEQRLDILYGLQQKHRVQDNTSLIAIYNEYRTRLENITGGNERIAELEREADLTDKNVRELAGEISRERTAAASILEKHVCETLGLLGFPHVDFKAVITGKEPSADGADTVNFLFSGNRNVAPAPVEKIASGGETSRLMLAIKTLLARHRRLPTIIFDEIDSGVSGRIADTMGTIISTLAAEMQIINITHLAQVASKGDTHFVVSKHNSDGDTVTEISRLDKEQRIEEIAKMLSGNTVTEAAMAQSRELLGI